MTAQALLFEMKNEGLEVSISPAGKLKYSGSDAAVKKWLPVLKEKKEEILTCLPAWRWYVTFPNRPAILSHSIPFATREDVRKLYPDATEISLYSDA